MMTINQLRSQIQDLIQLFKTTLLKLTMDTHALLFYEPVGFIPLLPLPLTPHNCYRLHMTTRNKFTKCCHKTRVTTTIPLSLHHYFSIPFTFSAINKIIKFPDCGTTRSCHNALTNDFSKISNPSHST